MIAFAEYLLKVLICSAVFTGYYWLALRNKLFHQWNRFYLLGAVVLSIAIPFAKFTIWQKTEQPTVAYQVLQNITTEEKWFEEEATVITTNQEFVTKETIALYVYSLITAIMLLLMVVSIVRIVKLFRRYPHWKLNGLTFVDTEAKGTPFSFLHFIFWNRKIDFESAEGQQIFSHELVHVQEKHSWDKLFMNLVLVFFWVNPFFWLMKKELTMIHEFIADQKAVANGDTSAFAAMILAAAFPGQTLPLTNPFFYSPIKRRLLMLSKLNNPKVGYISRLLLLPLLAFLFAAFVLKTKTRNEHFTSATLEREYVVVIDAGHGMQNGSANGGRAFDGYSEDEFAFALAKQVEALNTNEKIKILLSRKDESWVGNKERITFAQNAKADLFISLHGSIAMRIKNGSSYLDNPARGVEAYIPKMNTKLNVQNVLLGNAILNEVSKVIAPNRGVKTREKGIWILEQSSYPAILLECGFLSSKDDLKIMKDEEKRKEMAKAILKGIEVYLLSLQKGEVQQNSVLLNSPLGFLQEKQKDTLPKINKQIPDSIQSKLNAQSKNEELVIINGKIADKYMLSRKIISADKVTFLPKNSADAISKYGNAAKNGVIVFENVVFEGQSFYDGIPKQPVEPVFTKAEVMPQFQGGDVAWNQFIQQIIVSNTDSLQALRVNGTFKLNFTVETDGSVKEITASGLNNGSYLLKLFTNALTNGPKWIPAEQNGKKVRCKVERVITYKPIDTESEKANSSTVSVANQSVRILYIGIENELIVNGGKVPADKVIVTIDNGSIKKKDANTWVAYPVSPGTAVVTVSKNENGKLTQLMQSNFTVKNVPSPAITVAGSKSGRVAAEKMKQAQGLVIEDGWEITQFTVYLTGSNYPKPITKVCKGSGSFNKEVQELIADVTPGTTIVFDEVVAQLKGKKVTSRGNTMAFNLY